MKKYISLILILLSFTVSSQNKGIISGTIFINSEKATALKITVNNNQLVTYSDANGFYEFKEVPFGNHKITVSGMNIQTTKKSVSVKKEESYSVDFDLTNFQNNLNEVVVTGTKTFKRKTESPVIVNVLNSKMLDNLQVCNLSEGLKFQPGLRVETDCQTCNYTQLRMNGLAGGYSQILINGRPIFSPLMGLYGMEQLPVNMIERIEVVRGGGSSLYGSSAIGGTVNVITKVPKKDAFEINSTYYNINGKSNDYNLNGNATLVNENKNAGVSLFMSHREREHYDANGDNFSEIPLIENNSVGANFFLLPTEKSEDRIEY